MSEGSVLNRWRLVLGKNAEGRLPLETGAQELDQVLDFLYSREQSEDERQEQGGSEGSRLTVALWLNKVRRLFPRQAAEVLERHALNRYQLTELLTDKEVLEKLEPNQALLGTILGLKHLMSDSVLASARRIVKKVADELTKKMEQDLRRSTLGKLDRNTASPVRSMRNLDVKKTIRRNLRHYDRENRRLTLEQVYFNGRVKKYNPWHVVIAVDESGSMLDSVIHSAIMAGIFARMPMLDLKLVIFDTQVVDLSGYAGDPVEVLMSVQLGGGTNIAAYYQPPPHHGDPGVGSLRGRAALQPVPGVRLHSGKRGQAGGPHRPGQQRQARLQPFGGSGPGRHGRLRGRPHPGAAGGLHGPDHAISRIQRGIMDGIIPVGKEKEPCASAAAAGLALVTP